MIVIIRGRARVEFCHIKKKDFEKHWYEHRKSQLYKVYPEDLYRMTIYKYGQLQRKEEEVIVFPENTLTPDHPRAQCYDFDVCAMELDLHKIELPKSMIKGFGYVIKQFKSVKNDLKGLLIGGLIVGVLAYAFLFG